MIHLCHGSLEEKRYAAFAVNAKLGNFIIRIVRA
jgi:hypothetical protein